MNRELRDELSEYLRKYRIFADIRVTVADEIILSLRQGYADANEKTPLRENAVFSWYSISKQFLSIGLMKLYERGLFDFSDHPGKYVPEAAGFHPDVTVRNMIRHTSGMPCFYQTEGFRKDHPKKEGRDPRKDLLMLSSYSPFFLPDTDSRYTNTGFFIGALMIENLTGMSYSDYMEKEVFLPLGMKNTHIDSSAYVCPERVSGHIMTKRSEIVPVKPEITWMLGAGDCIGSADDLFQLKKEMKAPKLLKKESWEEILLPHPGNNKGMGCTVTNWHGKKRIVNNGGHVGFRTFHLFLPDTDVDLIILSNSGYHEEGRNEIAEIVYRHIFGNDSADQGPDLLMDQGYL